MQDLGKHHSLTYSLLVPTEKVRVFRFYSANKEPEQITKAAFACCCNLPICPVPLLYLCFLMYRQTYSPIIFSAYNRESVSVSLTYHDYSCDICFLGLAWPWLSITCSWFHLTSQTTIGCSAFVSRMQALADPVKQTLQRVSQVCQPIRPPLPLDQ